MSNSASYALWQKAVSFAARQHEGQLRKDHQTPYVAHPVRVAFVVRNLFGVSDPEILAAALLHDVIEDTTADYDDLEEAFGTVVADLVAALSKDARLPEPEREPCYDAVLAAAPWAARLIKLADVFDNYCDAGSDEVRDKMTKRAERAIRCAGDEPRLAEAVAVIRELLQHGPPC